MSTLDDTATRLQTFALSLPEAWEDHPWGEVAIKVRKKVFLFLGRPDDGRLTLSVKLPHSALDALEEPFTSPTGYGLGKSGWVSSGFSPADPAPDVELLLAWVEESYRAVAPKTLSKQLDVG